MEGGRDEGVRKEGGSVGEGGVRKGDGRRERCRSKEGGRGRVE